MYLCTISTFIICTELFFIYLVVHTYLQYYLGKYANKLRHAENILAFMSAVDREVQYEIRNINRKPKIVIIVNLNKEAPAPSIQVLIWTKDVINVRANWMLPSDPDSPSILPQRPKEEEKKKRVTQHMKKQRAK